MAESDTDTDMEIPGADPPVTTPVQQPPPPATSQPPLPAEGAPTASPQVPVPTAAQEREAARMLELQAQQVATAMQAANTRPQQLPPGQADAMQMQGPVSW